MDALQKVRDLMGLALHENTPEKERNEAALGAIRIIERYDLLGKKRVDVAAGILDRYTSPDFVEDVATRAEKIASGFDRVVGSIKKVSDGLPRRGRGRRYGGR